MTHVYHHVYCAHAGDARSSPTWAMRSCRQRPFVITTTHSSTIYTTVNHNRHYAAHPQMTHIHTHGNGITCHSNDARVMWNEARVMWNDARVMWNEARVMWNKARVMWNEARVMWNVAEQSVDRFYLASEPASPDLTEQLR